MLTKLRDEYIAFGKSFYVAPDGDDTAQGDIDHPLRTLQEALNRTRTGRGDVILLIPSSTGTYKADTPPIRLDYSKSGVKIIAPWGFKLGGAQTAQGTGHPVDDGDGDGVTTIFKIESINGTGLDDPSFGLQGGHEQIMIKDTWYTIDWVEGWQNRIILKRNPNPDNPFTGQGTAPLPVDLGSVSYRVRTAQLKLDYCGDVLIAGIKFYNPGTGILLGGSFNFIPECGNKVLECTFDSSEVGIDIIDWGALNVVSGCYFLGRQIGMRLKGIAFNRVVNCLFGGNIIGIENVDDSVIPGIVYDCDFIANAVDVVDTSHISQGHTIFKSCFWDTHIRNILQEHGITPPTIDPQNPNTILKLFSYSGVLQDILTEDELRALVLGKGRAPYPRRKPLDSYDPAVEGVHVPDYSPRLFPAQTLFDYSGDVTSPVDASQIEPNYERTFAYESGKLKSVFVKKAGVKDTGFSKPFRQEQIEFEYDQDGRVSKMVRKEL